MLVFRIIRSLFKEFLDLEIERIDLFMYWHVFSSFFIRIVAA